MLNFYVSDCQYCTFQRNIGYCTPGNPIQKVYTQRNLSMGSEGKEPTLSRNTIINNLLLGGDRNFTTGTGMKESIFAHNTLVNAVGDYNVIIFGGDASGGVFKNNIILQEDSIPVAVNSATGITFGYNNWSKTPPSSVQGMGDVIDDPKIAKTGPTGPGELTAEYFKLLSDSPAIDKALPLAEVKEDYFGNPRGESPDIGAHEFGGGLEGTRQRGKSSMLRVATQRLRHNL
jgi:hypothetical protein